MARARRQERSGRSGWSRRLAAAPAVLVTVVSGACTPFESFDVGGVRRDVLVHSSSQSQMPVVVVFHGAYSNPEDMESYTGFSEVADDHGFLVVYPKGKFGLWNDGRIPDVYDDVAMTRALLDHLDAGYDVDLDRVFVTGISNGGFMSHRIGCDLSDEVLGIAPVAGSLSEELAAECDAVPLATMMIAGDDDRLVPYEGGDLGGGWTGGLFGTMRSMTDSAAFWADAAECGDAVTVESDDKDDGTSLETRTYDDCLAPVVLHTVVGGGHTWPGARHIPGLGTVSEELDASEAIWSFFESLEPMIQP